MTANRSGRWQAFVVRTSCAVLHSEQNSNLTYWVRHPVNTIDASKPYTNIGFMSQYRWACAAVRLPQNFLFLLSLLHFADLGYSVFAVQFY